MEISVFVVIFVAWTISFSTASNNTLQLPLTINRLLQPAVERTDISKFFLIFDKEFYSEITFSDIINTIQYKPNVEGIKSIEGLVALAAAAKEHGLNRSDFEFLQTSKWSINMSVQELAAVSNKITLPIDDSVTLISVQEAMFKVLEKRFQFTMEEVVETLNKSKTVIYTDLEPGWIDVVRFITEKNIDVLAKNYTIPPVCIAESLNMSLAKLYNSTLLQLEDILKNKSYIMKEAVERLSECSAFTGFTTSLSLSTHPTVSSSWIINSSTPTIINKTKQMLELSTSTLVIMQTEMISKTLSLSDSAANTTVTQVINPKNTTEGTVLTTSTINLEFSTFTTPVISTMDVTLWTSAAVQNQSIIDTLLAQSTPTSTLKEDTFSTDHHFSPSTTATKYFLSERSTIPTSTSNFPRATNTVLVNQGNNTSVLKKMSTEIQHKTSSYSANTESLRRTLSYETTEIPRETSSFPENKGSLHGTMSRLVNTESLHKTSSYSVNTTSLRRKSSNSASTANLDRTSSYLVNTDNLHGTPSHLVNTENLHRTSSYSVNTESLRKKSSNSASTANLDRTSSYLVNTDNLHGTPSHLVKTENLHRTASYSVNTASLRRKSSNSASTANLHKTSSYSANTESLRRTLSYETTEIPRETSSFPENKGSLHGTTSRLVNTESLHKTSSYSVNTTSLRRKSSNSASTANLDRTSSYLVNTDSLHGTPSHLVNTENLHRTSSYSVNTASVRRKSSNSASTANLHRTSSYSANTESLRKTSSYSVNTESLHKTSSFSVNTEIQQKMSYFSTTTRPSSSSFAIKETPEVSSQNSKATSTTSRSSRVSIMATMTSQIPNNSSEITSTRIKETMTTNLLKSSFVSTVSALWRSTTTSLWSSKISLKNEKTESIQNSTESLKLVSSMKLDSRGISGVLFPSSYQTTSSPSLVFTVVGTSTTSISSGGVTKARSNDDFDPVMFVVVPVTAVLVVVAFVIGIILWLRSRRNLQSGSKKTEMGSELSRKGLVDSLENLNRSRTTDFVNKGVEDRSSRSMSRTSSVSNLETIQEANEPDQPEIYDL